MFRSMKTLFAVATLAVALAPAVAGATDAPRNVTCSVNVSYAVNNGTPQVYQKDFLVEAGTTFHDEFGTIIRFKEFNASTSVDADGKTVVSFDYYSDVNAFDAVEFSSSLTLTDEKGTQVAGRNAFYTSHSGFSASHRTDYVLFCTREGK